MGVLLATWLTKTKVIKILKASSLCSLIISIILVFFIKDNSILISPNDIKKISEGDIILTNGQSIYSRVINLLKLDMNSYTHIGFIINGNNTLCVIHSTPDGTSENGIRIDEIQHFIDLSDANAIKIFRISDLDKNKLSYLINIIGTYKNIKKPFDYGFNNADKSKLYCSELVYDILWEVNLLKNKKIYSGIIYPTEILNMVELNEVLALSFKSN